MKAISTKYLGPTNTKPSRIVASDGDGNRHTIVYGSALASEDAHRKAAEGLRDKMDWPGELIGGATKDGYAFVFAPTTYQERAALRALRAAINPIRNGERDGAVFGDLSIADDQARDAIEAASA